MAHILVVYELRDRQIKKASLEATTAGAKLRQELNGTLSALLLGTDIGELSQIPGKYGAQKVYLVDDPALAKHSPDIFAGLVSEVVRDIGATHILMGASSMGKDIMPRVAFHLASPLAQDVTGIEVQDGKIIYTRPVIAGKLQAQLHSSGEFQLATLRPNVFTALESPVPATIEKLSKTMAVPKVVVQEISTASGGKLDVTEAEIIVSGGRGMQGPENWHLIENLAGVLGAATGASRAVVDAGWREHAEQVGQTGKTVSPTLYVACGISGAIQHQAGMASSKYIVAINKDPEAPIFKLADYGVVGDVMQILPVFTDELQKVKNL